jgi:hypothetical protein
MHKDEEKMIILEFLLYLSITFLAAPFILFFCGKWGAFGWFKGKDLAKRVTEERNNTDDWN